MSRFIRWPGLAAFFVIVALGAAVWLLMVDFAVRHMIEKTGTKAVGARVAVADADLSLFPLGLEISGLQVTNPNSPMRNAVVAERIRMNFNTGEIIKGNKVVEDLSATGVGFDKPRKTSGAIAKKEKTSEEPETAVAEKMREKLGRLPSATADRARQIIENEQLETLKQAETLQQEIADARQRFSQRLESLPDQETFADYKKRINALKGAGGDGGLLGTLGRAGEAGEIRKDIQADLQSLRETRQDLTETRAKLQSRLADLRAAPGRDARRLTDKYALSPEGIGNMSALILGPKYAGWVENGLSWYLRLSPHVSAMMKKSRESEKPQRREGIDVRFASRRPVPGYWIKIARVSADMGGMDVSGQIRDIASDPRVLGRPLEFDFAGTGAEDAGRIEINGRLDRTNPENPSDRADFQIRDHALSGLQLMDEDSMSVVLSKASLDAVDGKIRIAGDQLDAEMAADVSAARFDVNSGEKKHFLVQALASALGDIRSFDVAATLGGTLTQPEISIDSGLGDVLKASLSRDLEKHRAQMQQKLNQAISEKTGGAIDETESGFSALDGIEQELKKRLHLGSSIL
ncbi:MAG: TIGR03545 family protein [Desulfobacterales bacterium]|nr:TIGR03545 family protein [Desulfobacterales bacterium]